MSRAIDCWVNVNMEELGTPDYLVQVASRYFKQGEDFFRNYEIGEMLELMDANGVERAILTTDPGRPSEILSSLVDRLNRWNGDQLAASDATLLLCRATERAVGWKDNLLAPFRLLTTVADKTRLG